MSHQTEEFPEAQILDSRTDNKSAHPLVTYRRGYNLIALRILIRVVNGMRHISGGGKKSRSRRVAKAYVEKLIREEQEEAAKREARRETAQREAKRVAREQRALERRAREDEEERNRMRDEIRAVVQQQQEARELENRAALREQRAIAERTARREARRAVREQRQRIEQVTAVVLANEARHEVAFEPGPPMIEENVQYGPEVITYDTANVSDEDLLSDDFYTFILTDESKYVHPIQYHGRTITHDKARFIDNYRLTDYAKTIRDRIVEYEANVEVGDERIDRLWSALWARVLDAAFHTYFGVHPVPDEGAVGWGQIVFSTTVYNDKGKPDSEILHNRQVPYYYMYVDRPNFSIAALAHAIYELKYPTPAKSYTAYGDTSKGGSDNHADIVDANFTMKDDVEIFNIKRPGGEPITEKLPLDTVIVCSPDAKNRELDGYCLAFAYLSIADACRDDKSMLLLNNKLFKLPNNPAKVSERSDHLITKVLRQTPKIAVAELDMLLNALGLRRGPEGLSWNQLGLNDRPLWDLFEEYLDITVGIVSYDGTILHRPTESRRRSKSCAAIVYTVHKGKGHYRLALQLQSDKGKVMEVSEGLVYYEKIAEELSKCDAELETKPAEVKLTKVMKSHKKLVNESPIRYVFYDLETVNRDGYTYVYSCMAILAESMEKRPSKLTDLNNTNSFVGTTVASFVEWLMGPVCSSYRLVIVAFNGSKFDHIFLVEELAKRSMIVPDSALLVSNSVYSLVTTNGWRLFDLAKFLLGSLDSCCKNFKTVCCKVGGFDHSIPQKAYDEGKLGDWVRENNDKLYEYNMMDCMSLCELTFKAEAAFKSVSKMIVGEKSSILNHATIASFSYKILKKVGNMVDRPHKPKEIKAAKARVKRAKDALNDKSDGVRSSEKLRKLEQEKKILEQMVKENKGCKASVERQLPGPPQNYNDYKFFRSAIVAGRTQNMSGKPVCIQDTLAMIDICSSYPHVMNTCMFPSGEYVAVDCEHPDKLGVYECEFDQSVLKEKGLPVIIPLRTENNPLDWTYYGSMKCTLVTPDIISLREQGVDVKVGNGYVWNISSDRQFRDYIEPLFRRKQFLDAHKNDEQGNDAEREAVKLMMNSVSGKVGQRLFAFNINELSPSVAHSSALLSILEPESVQLGTEVPNCLYIHGVVKEKLRDEIYEKHMRTVAPTITAAFIYAYARRNLYQALKYNGLYCDTDSVIMRWSDYQRFAADNPNILAGKVKELGQWEMESKQDGTVPYTFYGILPKQYALIPDDATNNPFLKLKLKGVGKRDILVPDDQLLSVRKLTNDERGTWSVANRNNKFGSIEVAKRAFDAQVEGKKTYWLCSQVRRCAGLKFEAKFLNMIKVVAPLVPQRSVIVSGEVVSEEVNETRPLVQIINRNVVEMMRKIVRRDLECMDEAVRRKYIDELQEFKKDMPTLESMLKPRNDTERMMWKLPHGVTYNHIVNIHGEERKGTMELYEKVEEYIEDDEHEAIDEIEWGRQCILSNVVASLSLFFDGDCEERLLLLYRELPSMPYPKREHAVIDVIDDIRSMESVSDDVILTCMLAERRLLWLNRREHELLVNIEDEL